MKQIAVLFNDSIKCLIEFKKEIEKANYANYGDKFKPLDALGSFDEKCRRKLAGMLNRYVYDLKNKNEKIENKFGIFRDFLNKITNLLFYAQHKLVLKETLFAMLADFDKKILYADMSAVAYCVLF
ncbi:unnamed protein product [Meloidogyne enterolobii]|uniref:Uncharacterized protein n=1 Tax=Meloidogyne enterolobii TaxID=390850 RepID=A0ACB0XRV9_MELEN